MGIVAMIGLIFGPFVSLLFAAWFYVRWQNEEDEELALHNKKICFRALIAAAILLVVFGILKLIDPGTGDCGPDHPGGLLCPGHRLVQYADQRSG